jgi:uncharacterized lipoprotein YmbA
MTFAARALAFLFPFLLAACGSPELVSVSAPEITKKSSIAFASVEVRNVSLPSYAATDEIHIRAEDGTLSSPSSVLWSDAPERSIALELSQNLARLTGRRVASEPWPFEAFPDARLEVRFTELVATTAGNFVTSGQYFVAVTDGRRERSGQFDMNVAFDPKGGPSAIARARGQLILDLAEFIAHDGLK